MRSKEDFQSDAHLIGDSRGGREELRGAGLSGIESIIQNNSGAALKAFGRDGVICHWNSECEKLYGYTAQEALGRRVQELLLSGRSAADFEQNLEKIFKFGKAIVPLVYNIGIRSGKTRIIFSIMFAVFNGAEPDKVFCVDIDITDQRWAEDLICERQEHYRTLLETISTGIVETDILGRIDFANHHLHNVFGYSQQELSGEQILVLVPAGRERNDLQQYLRRFVREQCLPMPYYGRGLKKDGKLIEIQVNWDYKRDRAGKLTGFIAVVSDISEQKKTERACQESKNRFKALVSNISGAVYRSYCDWTWTVKYVSEAIEEISGYPASDFVENNVHSYASIIHPDDREMVERIVLEAVGQKKPFEIEYRIIHARGDVRWVYDKGQGILDSAGKLLYLDGIIFDVTERKETESFLELSEKVLMNLTQKDPSLEVIRETLKIVKEHTGFEVVRICLGNDDNLQHYELEKVCLKADSNLSCIYICSQKQTCKKISCDLFLCSFYGALLADKIPAGQEHFTEGGSFWVNSISKFKESCLAGKAGYQGNGYESRAFIPLRSDQRIVGVLEVAGSRAGLFTVKLIYFLERIGTKLGMALAKIRAQEKITSLARFPFEDPFPVLRIGSNGIILHCNPAGLSFLDNWGCAIGDCCPQGWRELVTEAINSGCRKSITGKCDHRIFTFVIVPVAGLGYANIYGHDVTEQREAEVELLQLNQELERRVVERTTRLAKTQKYLLQEIEERKAIEKELLEISEREKRLIGQELHDSVGQKLAGVALMAKVLEQKLSGKSEAESSKASGIARHVNEAMDRVRDLARGLHPVDLVGGSLSESLKELASMTERLFGIRCQFTNDKDVLINDNTSAVHLYRISQEAITNAIKHGKTKNIRIELLGRRKKTVLKVENDGEDFPEVMPKKSGMGLQIMDYRAEMIGGSLDVRRRQGGGTVVKCVFANGGG